MKGEPMIRNFEMCNYNIRLFGQHGNVKYNTGPLEVYEIETSHFIWLGRTMVFSKSKRT